MRWCWLAAAMTSFRPLWTASAADHADDTQADEKRAEEQRPSAPLAFAPIWQGGGKRDFVLTQLKVDGSAVINADPHGVADLQVQETAGVETDSPITAESAAVAAEKDEPLQPDELAQDSAVFAPAPPAVPMMTCEEHARLMEIERAAGVEAGRLAGRAEAAAMIDAERETMRAYLASIAAAFSDGAAFFAPLKKLALHLAQQLVRGELQASGAAVSRLIDQCLAGAGDRRPLAIHLHPDDVEMFRKLRGEGCAGLPLVEDASFAPGSVRVEFNDGWIEDMMQDRLDEVATALHAGAAGDPQPVTQKI